MYTIQYQNNMWERYRKDILSLEQVFDETLQESEEDIKELLSDSISVLLVNDKDHVVGGIIGKPVGDLEIPQDDWAKEYFNNVQWMFNDRSDIYISSIVVHPDYRSVKYTNLLFKTFLHIAEKDWFYRAVFHVAKKTMNVLKSKFGAKELMTIPNWYNTGKTYYLGGMDL
jgi:ribosomal protein S18 acetylase RimI-like enzyme